jgi:hypothetical protein
LILVRLLDIHGRGAPDAVPEGRVVGGLSREIGMRQWDVGVGFRPKP